MDNILDVIKRAVVHFFPNMSHFFYSYWYCKLLSKLFFLNVKPKLKFERVPNRDIKLLH